MEVKLKYQYTIWKMDKKGFVLPTVMVFIVISSLYLLLEFSSFTNDVYALKAYIHESQNTIEINSIYESISSRTSCSDIKDDQEHILRSVCVSEIPKNIEQLEKLTQQQVDSFFEGENSTQNDERYMIIEVQNMTNKEIFIKDINTQEILKIIKIV